MIGDDACTAFVEILKKLMDIAGDIAKEQKSKAFDKKLTKTPKIKVGRLSKRKFIQIPHPIMGLSRRKNHICKFLQGFIVQFLKSFTISLYDGISCGMLALLRAGIHAESYDAFEIDKYAVQISEKNFPEIVHHGNVFDGDFTKFKGYDLLLGGSPCTYWSIAKAGRETTPDGMGGKLFMEYVRALHESGTQQCIEVRKDKKSNCLTTV